MGHRTMSCGAAYEGPNAESRTHHACQTLPTNPNKCLFGGVSQWCISCLWVVCYMRIALVVVPGLEQCVRARPKQL